MQPLNEPPQNGQPISRVNHSTHPSSDQTDRPLSTAFTLLKVFLPISHSYSKRKMEHLIAENICSTDFQQYRLLLGRSRCPLNHLFQCNRAWVEGKIFLKPWPWWDLFLFSLPWNTGTSVLYNTLLRLMPHSNPCTPCGSWTARALLGTSTAKLGPVPEAWGGFGKARPAVRPVTPSHVPRDLSISSFT